PLRVRPQVCRELGRRRDPLGVPDRSPWTGRRGVARHSVRPERDRERRKAGAVVRLLLLALFLPAIALADPKPAPKFEATGFDGKKVTLDQFEGKVVLLDYWASWCEPCKKAIPELDKIQAEYGGKGLVVLGVSMDQEKDHQKARDLAAGKSYRFAFDNAD